MQSLAKKNRQSDNKGFVCKLNSKESKYCIIRPIEKDNNYQLFIELQSYLQAY